MSLRQQAPVTHINVFTPHPGMMDAFVAAQLEGLPKFGTIPGSRGSSFYCAEDKSCAVLVTHWDDEAAHRSFIASDAFTRHREKLLPLIARSEGRYHRLLFTRAPAEVVDTMLVLI